MKKQIKLLSILGCVALIGGVSTLSVLTTSCGKKGDDSLNLAKLISHRELGIIEDYHSSPDLFKALEDAGNVSIYAGSVILTWDPDNIHVTIKANPDGIIHYYGSVTCTYIWRPLLPNWDQVQIGSHIKSINLTNAEWCHKLFSYTPDTQNQGSIIVEPSSGMELKGLMDANVSTFNTTQTVPNEINCLFSTGNVGEVFCTSTFEEILWRESFVSTDNSFSWNKDTRTITFDTAMSVDLILIVPEYYYGFFKVAQFVLE